MCIRDRYIRIWYIRPRVKKADVGISHQTENQKENVGIYTRYVSKQYFTQKIYKFPDRLVGGSDCFCFYSSSGAEVQQKPSYSPTMTS